MVEVRWTEQSIEDIANIAEYIGNDSLRYAEAFVKRIFEKTEILVTQPTAGKIVPEIKNRAIRELLLGNYLIIYVVRIRHIDILTVFHSARLLKNSSLFE